MTPSSEPPWLDGQASRPVRPYTITGGRVKPLYDLDLATLVTDTHAVAHTRLTPEHAQALAVCQVPTAVAEIAARLRLPLAVTKILLADLIGHGAAVTGPPRPATAPSSRADLEAVLDGLRSL